MTRFQLLKRVSDFFPDEAIISALKHQAKLSVKCS